MQKLTRRLRGLTRAILHSACRGAATHRQAPAARYPRNRLVWWLGDWAQRLGWVPAVVRGAAGCGGVRVLPCPWCGGRGAAPSVAGRVYLGVQLLS